MYLKLLIMFFICFGAFVEASTSQNDPINYKKQMCEYIKCNDLKKVKLLIKSGWIEVDEPISEHTHNTPLLEAARQGHFNIVKYLIRAGADIHVINEYNDNVLHEIIKAKYLSQKHAIEMTEYLVSLGISVNAPGSDGYTALMYACKGQRYNLFKALIDLGADVHMRSNNGSTMLMIAVAEDNVAVMEFLVQNNSDLDLINTFGFNAFTWSIRLGKWNAFQFFVDHRADINQHTLNGGTPLIWAVFYQQPHILQQLIALGADVNARTTRPIKISPSTSPFDSINSGYETLPVGSTALHFAKKLNAPAMIELLEQAGGAE